MSFSNFGKIFLVAATMALGGLTAGGAQAAVTADTFVGSTRLSDSSEPGELAYMASLLGVGAGVLTSTKIDDALGWSYDSTADAWYKDVAPAMPGYFLLKFGKGGHTFDTHYVFKNIADLTKLVFANGDTNNLAGSGVSIEKLSHVTLGLAAIPVPAGIWTLGLGLGALGFAARRKRRHA
ncbi:VPLPA-CTERM sorting domain-containing protein [Tropicimonas sp. TH_r6]|uniref:VPLPA-CTERM sorting domain-containing protein n=1 Tax=Tropicimonas sp. TH_r6 TaxID=3082085 RepID=UPI002954FD02|nr:VPLPA-CTERM sorting domain-containing protein [Tropicimonas sp. TH_r6]MDV7145548.1 VPLPA-CTERM sorting domain-containing protein [Tropicimonas sp. TH_r6]